MTKSQKTNKAKKNLDSSNNISKSFPKLESLTDNEDEHLHEPRKGVYSCSRLLYNKEAKAFFHEFSNLEHVCIIRFPPDIAAILRQRLDNHNEYLQNILQSQNIFDSIENTNQIDSASSNILGLTITPTPLDDYRQFSISFQKVLGDTSSTVQLIGMLVELPCIMEAYKSLEGELLFKSNDISQLLYVFYPENNIQLDFRKIRNMQSWSWHSGITPGTHQIQSRKFKNFYVFDPNDFSSAEKEIYNIMNPQSINESISLDSRTELEMETHLDSIVSNRPLTDNVIAVIGPQNPILYAAVKHISMKNALEHDEVKNLGSTLLRKYIEDQQDLALPSNNLLISSDPAIQIPDTEIISFNLADRLFNLEQEDILKDSGYYFEESVGSYLNEDYLKGSLSSSSSSYSSLSSEINFKAKTEDRRRKSKKSTFTDTTN